MTTGDRSVVWRESSRAHCFRRVNGFDVKLVAGPRPERKSREREKGD